MDRGLIAPVLENEPITESKLAPALAGAGLSPAIHPGMRAMSVKVNEVIAHENLEVSELPLRDHVVHRKKQERYFVNKS